MSISPQILVSFKRSAVIPSQVPGDAPRTYANGERYYLRTSTARDLWLDGAIEIVQPVQVVGVESGEQLVAGWQGERVKRAAQAKQPPEAPPHEDTEH